MSAPKTPLLVAPSGEANLFGRSMESSDLIKGLRDLNADLFIPDPSTFQGWYPGKGLGMTCIWIGPQEHDRKVCGFSLGTIPEYTQVCPEGLLARGWRSIFEKCIAARVVTRAAVERKFRVSLSYDGRDRVCTKCQEEGERVTVDTASGLCDAHDAARKNVNEFKSLKQEALWLSSR